MRGSEKGEIIKEHHQGHEGRRQGGCCDGFVIKKHQVGGTWTGLNERTGQGVLIKSGRA